MSAAWALYRLALPALGAVAPWVRPLAPARERPFWGERMGGTRLPGGCDAWIHAASLGETLGVPPLAAALQAHRPEARLLFTATTVTGRARLAALGSATALAPIDSPQAVAAFFRNAGPRRVILVETELWPHWLLRAREAGVPVAVVSARLSPRSVRGYARLGEPLRRLVSGLAAVLCQTEEDAARWRAIGAEAARTRVTGNLKHDALPDPPADRAAARAAAGLDPARPALVLGSLRPGEAALLARAWRGVPEAARAGWQVVAVPRHQSATAELQREAADAGVANDPATAPGSDAWRWDDRPLVLAGYYAAADVAVVGGSLLSYGGHNPMEPAACGVAVIMGPHHESQMEAVRLLRDAGAAIVLDRAEALPGALAALLTDPAQRAARARQAIAAVASLRGAARRVVAELERMGLWPA